MFTGIIEEIGEVLAVEKMPDGVRITVGARKVLNDLKVDDSISIDGACQTVIKCDPGSFTVEAVGETLQKTTLGQFRSGRRVNLERALTLQTRLGGHLVQGHINGTGRITQWFPRGENYFLEVEIPSDLTSYCIREGSIALDGISLTIARMEDNRVGVSIIPHTVKYTTLQEKKVGDLMNVEVDVIARYVKQFLNETNSSNLSIEKLKKWGY